MPKKQKEEAEGDDLLGVPEDLLFVEHTVHAQDVITAYIEEVSEKLYQQNIKTREDLLLQSMSCVKYLK